MGSSSSLAKRFQSTLFPTESADRKPLTWEDVRSLDSSLTIVSHQNTRLQFSKYLTDANPLVSALPASAWVYLPRLRHQSSCLSLQPNKYVLM